MREVRLVAKWMIRARARCYIDYIFDAETEDDEIRLWENAEQNGGSIDEESLENEEFYSIDEIPEKAPKWENTPLGNAVK